MHTSDKRELVRARGLVKRYRSVVALDGLDLSVAAGEIVCLLGANGAGKTTTLHVLLGFLRADAGEASVSGIDVAREPHAARARAGYLPEVVELYPLLTGRETLHYFEELAGRRVDRDAATAALQRVGLRGDAIDERVGTYSKGCARSSGWRSRSRRARASCSSTSRCRAWTRLRRTTSWCCCSSSPAMASRS